MAKSGVLCFRRRVIQGLLPSVCHAGETATLLDSRGIRMFNYFAEFEQSLSELIRTNAERPAPGRRCRGRVLKKSKRFRKEDRIREILAKRGKHLGAIHIRGGSCLRARLMPPIFRKESTSCNHAITRFQLGTVGNAKPPRYGIKTPASDADDLEVGGPSPSMSRFPFLLCCGS